MRTLLGVSVRLVARESASAYRCTFDRTHQASSMSDTDILGLVLGAIAILMFATGILLVV
ncbi:hypothetical protein C438_18265 [Haloferax denitrificans ATCC 35960]|uniref:Uncharacterized protein n=1 Tax=Haloferax denitrificans ATCC 35960 TaxID=662478 RepID=M0IUL5_9EURY|nr:hypothetical protein C438_18265 [Haloferax denitrificans ATCC 35960]